jgi:hypothetical protein
VVFENLPEPENIRENQRSLKITDSHNFYKTNYPLTVVIVPVFPLLIGINYDFNLVDVATIDAVLNHFQIVLKFILGNPDACLQDIEITLSTVKQQQIIAMLEQQATFNFETCSPQKQ